jgi:hypothetical protein
VNDTVVMVEISSFVTAVLLGAVGSVALVTVHRIVKRKNREKEQDNELPDSTILTRLLPKEENYLKTQLLVPIASGTWVEVEESDNTKGLEKLRGEIKQRLERMLEANPWLLGKFITKNKSEFYIAHSIKDPSVTIQDIFHVSTPSSDIYYGMSYTDLLVASKSHTRQAKKEFDQPFLSVDVIPCYRSPNQRLMVFFSMSHFIGDGHTYYQFYHMLMGAEPVRPLICTRIAATHKHEDDAFSHGTPKWIITVGFVTSFLHGWFVLRILSPLVGRKASAQQPHFFLVNHAKIEVLKKKCDVSFLEKLSVPFVSTNDILTSWGLTNAGIRHCLMAVGFRNRLEGHTDSHAGNYAASIIYRSPEDTETPELIRMSVQTLKRAATLRRPFSVWEMLFGMGGVAISSNWSTFSSINPVSGCKELLHLPLFDKAGLPPVTWSIFVIFRFKPDQLAMIVVAPPQVLKRLSEALPSYLTEFSF